MAVPIYDVVVSRTRSKDRYMCFLLIEDSHELNWGRYTGLGNTPQEAIEDWRERVLEWVHEHKEITSWPNPRVIDSKNPWVLEMFKWSPPTI